MVDVNAIQTEHEKRLHGLDALLVVGPPDGDGELLHAAAGGAIAIGRTASVDVEAGSEAAPWGALRTRSLSIGVAGQRREQAVAALLDRWDGHLAAVATPGDDDTAAVVRWPSRDLDGARSLALRGFAPLKTIAVRPAGRPLPAVPSSGQAGGLAGVTVRPAVPADATRLGELAWRLMLSDVPWGMVTERPGAREHLAAGIAADLGDPGAVLLAAESGGPGGALVGYAFAQSVAASRWIGGLVAARPVAYVASLYVEPDRRSAGVGVALATELLRRLDAAGVAVSVLHHATPSPVSTPFWARLGYRPLWTMWQRRPAVR